MKIDNLDSDREKLNCSCFKIDFLKEVADEVYSHTNGLTKEQLVEWIIAYKRSKVCRCLKEELQKCLSLLIFLDVTKMDENEKDLVINRVDKIENILGQKGEIK